MYLFYLNDKFLVILKMTQERHIKKATKLRIERLEKSRSGRSLCYIDQDIMFELGLSTGDIIELRGKKKTTGIAVSHGAL